MSGEGKPAKEMSARERIRAEVFKSRKPASKVITFMGEKIELRQPTLGSIIDASNQENRQAGIIDTLVNYAFVPGTDELVFEETDAPSFKAMPFGADFQRVAKTLEEITEVNFLDQKTD